LKHTTYIDSQQHQVFTGPCCYDIILGCDFLCKVHFHIDFQNNTISCMDMSFTMHNPDFFTDSTCLQDVMFFEDAEVDSHASLIKESTYKLVSISFVSGAFVFHRDMILLIFPLLQILINYIQSNKSSLMNVSNVLIYDTALWIINLVMKY
jgi:hypothetical protein